MLSNRVWKEGLSSGELQKSCVSVNQTEMGECFRTETDLYKPLVRPTVLWAEPICPVKNVVIIFLKISKILQEIA